MEAHVVMHRGAFRQVPEGRGGGARVDMRLRRRGCERGSGAAHPGTGRRGRGTVPPLLSGAEAPVSVPAAPSLRRLAAHKK
ncbi:hypothetical protein SHKM778_42850 [Streptomyces sp. KM77-8]|uniref:Uncharacterized protein n=1 Tax=Streptomyces haneummycinicus TaxID=3074435 RepID=A0AAT9HKD2_9ACTN